MSTLQSQRVADMLDKLFADAIESGSLAENFAFVLETAVPPPRQK
jgi:hypothetical protein